MSIFTKSVLCVGNCDALAGMNSEFVCQETEKPSQRHPSEAV